MIKLNKILSEIKLSGDSEYKIPIEISRDWPTVYYLKDKNFPVGLYIFYPDVEANFENDMTNVNSFDYLHLAYDDYVGKELSNFLKYLKDKDVPYEALHDEGEPRGVRISTEYFKLLDLNEIKLSKGIEEPDYETAAKYLQSKLRIAGTDISEEVPGMKYGAYSHESWGLVARAMNKIGIKLKPEDERYDQVDEFVDKLRELNLIHLEW